MACRIPGKEDFAGTIAYFEAELERLEVAVHLETPMRDAGAPRRVRRRRRRDRRRSPADRAAGRRPAARRHYAELLNGGAWGERVAIIGAGGIGVDVAHLVSHRDVDFYAAYGLDPPGPAVTAATAPPRRRHASR